MLFTDSDGTLGPETKLKQVLGQTFIPLQLSEPDNHSQNPFERAIQNLNSRCSKIRNAYGTGILTNHYEMMDYLCNVNNYVARASLNTCLPYEAFWGETP